MKADLPENIFLEFFIAGLGHYDYEEVKDNLEIGTEVQLVPDPTNEYDPKAVKLMFEDHQLGFVPAKTGEARLVFDILSTTSRKLKATVSRNKPETLVHRRLQLWVKEED